MKRLALLLTVVVSLVGACSALGLGVPRGGPYPQACESLDFPARQCEAIVTVAQAKAGIAPETVTSIDILPPTPDGRVGGQAVARVRFHRSGQPDLTEDVHCDGGTRNDAFACDLNAAIGIYGRIDHDVPCGDDGETCATLPPSPRPAVQAIARPLILPSLDIPLDHLGPYELEIGEAGLPDGALSTVFASIGEPTPETFWIAHGIEIQVRPVDPARPEIGSVYRDPFDGVEPVKVFLVFEVTEITSPSVLQVRGLVVQ
jgi:hypothetical protein